MPTGALAVPTLCISLHFFTRFPRIVPATSSHAPSSPDAPTHALALSSGLNLPRILRVTLQPTLSHSLFAAALSISRNRPTRLARFPYTDTLVTRRSLSQARLASYPPPNRLRASHAHFSPTLLCTTSLRVLFVASHGSRSLPRLQPPPPQSAAQPGLSVPSLLLGSLVRRKSPASWAHTEILLARVTRARHKTRCTPSTFSATVRVAVQHENGRSLSISRERPLHAPEAPLARRAGLLPPSCPYSGAFGRRGIEFSSSRARSFSSLIHLPLIYRRR